LFSYRLINKQLKINSPQNQIWQRFDYKSTEQILIIMKTKLKQSIMLLGAVAMASYANAQDNIGTPEPFTKANAYRTWSFGVTGGVMSPVVLTGGKNDFSNWEVNAGYGGYLKKQFTHNFGIQGDFFR
jgi:OOP family OmpA-OmpF porin